ncbi:MAG: hypothetical protein HYS21_04075 [Deltaproteobacteria bacterium]|nr:hypothetical protein [Deltaproteobacteria bacterium]
MLKQLLLLIIISLSVVRPAFSTDKPILYTDLIKGADGSYTISEISAKENKIELTTLKPVGFETGKWDCSKILFGKYYITDNKKCIPDGSQFRAERFRLLPTVFLGAATAGISLVLGLTVQESVFDQDQFEKAVNQAFDNSGLSKNRDKIVQSYERIFTMGERYNEDLSFMLRKYTEEYNHSVPQTDKILIDESGLYSNDILVDVIIKTNKNHIAMIQAPKYEFSSFYVSLPEFDEKVKSLEEYFHTSKADYEDKLRSASATYNVICGPDYMPPYHLRYECPPMIPRETLKPSQLTAIIESKDLSNIFPGNFPLENGSFKALFNRDQITIQNKDKNLKILKITLTYNGKTSSVAFDNDSRAQELAPLEKRNIPASRLMTKEIEKASEYKEMTVKKAAKEKLSFGLSIEYKLDKGELKTLSDTREFRVEELM